ncbi:hypothetical protein [uncultured Mediterranean phage uvMED]|jgi:hypothetical protein|nr:hypothetical protein [uncultured Mediterranean phage uvMED]
MKPIGDVSTGVEEREQSKLDVRANNTTVAQADSSGLTTNFAFRHPNTITGNVTIDSDENCVMAGPITVEGTLTVNGTLVIV